MKIRGFLLVVPALVACSLPPPGYGQPAAGVGVQQELAVRQVLDAARRGPPIRPGIHGSVSAGANMIFPSDLEDGGELGVNRQSIAGGVENVLSNGTMFGFVFDHERSQYDFSDAAPEVSSGLDHVSASRFGVNLRSTLNDKWSMFGAVDVTYSVAGGADRGDGRTGGGLISFQRKVSENFSFSLGLLARTRLEKRAMIFPIPGIDWKITRRLTFRTAQGGTLSWQIDDRRKWIANFSAGYEGRSFRLDEGGSLPGGVVDERRVPVTASLRYGPNPGMFARVFAGAAFAQKLEFLDSDGDRVETLNADPSLIAGVSGAIRF